MRKVRMVALGLLVGLVGPLAVVPALQPAAAAGTRNGTHWVLKLAPTTVIVDDTTYRFRLMVAAGKSCTSGEYCRLVEGMQVVGRSRHRSGVASAVQENFFRFSLPGAGGPYFRHATDLTSAAVHAASDYGAHIAVNVKFASDGPAKSTCDGHTRTRPGTISGRLRFRPLHSLIGTISKLPHRATLTYADGTCPLNPYKNPTYITMRPCEPGTVFVIGEAAPPTSRLNFIARRDPDADTATVDVLAREAKYASVYYTVHAVVPANHVQVAHDLSSATLRGAAGSALTGNATSSAEDPDDQPVPWPFPFDCESAGVGATMGRSLGPFHGDFGPQFWAGGHRGTDTIQVNTSAYLVGAAP